MITCPQFFVGVREQKWDRVKKLEESHNFVIKHHQCDYDTTVTIFGAQKDVTNARKNIEKTHIKETISWGKSKKTPLNVLWLYMARLNTPILLINLN